MESKHLKSCLDELEKLGETSPEEAQKALERLESMEKNKPTVGQVARYGAIGAIGGPLMHTIGAGIRGHAPFDIGKRGVTPSKVLRSIAADAATGAISGGAIPLVRGYFDRKAEEKKLQNFMEEYRKAPEPDDGVTQKVGGIGQGASMTASEYSGPLSYGAFPLVSGLPNKAPPSLQAPVEKKAEYGPATGFATSQYSTPIEGYRPHVLASGQGGPPVPGLRGVIKKASGPLIPKGKTPGARLREAKDVGTSAHNSVPGPGIKQTVKGPSSPAFNTPGMPKMPAMPSIPGVKHTKADAPGMGKAQEGLSRQFVKSGAVEEQREEGTEQAPFWKRHMPALAGLGAAALAAPLAYRHIRAPRYSSNPVLRKMQEASGGRFSRQISKTEPKGFLAPLEKAYDRLSHDVDDVVYFKPYGAAKPKKMPGTLLHWDVDQGTALGDVNVGLPTKEQAKLLGKINEQKWNEYQYFNKHAPGSMAESENLGDVLSGLGVKAMPRSAKGRRALFEKLQEHLHSQYGDTGFLMKEVGGVQSSGMFPTESHNLADLYEGYSKGTLPAQYKKFLKMDPSKSSWNDALASMKADPNYSGRVLEQALSDPSKVMIQRKLKLDRPTGMRRLVGKALGQPASKEIRVHVYNGQAIPELATARFDPTMDIFERKKLHRAAAYAQEIVNQLPEKHRGSSFAMDIAPLKGGGFKMVESNPGAASGISTPEKNPLMPFKIRRALTGQWSPTVAGAGGLAAGAAAGGAAYGATKALQPTEEQPKQPVTSVP